MSRRLAAATHKKPLLVEERVRKPKLGCDGQGGGVALALLSVERCLHRRPGHGGIGARELGGVRVNGVAESPFAGALATSHPGTLTPVSVDTSLCEPGPMSPYASATERP